MPEFPVKDMTVQSGGQAIPNAACARTVWSRATRPRKA
jgi:hypothetical protein